MGGGVSMRMKFFWEGSHDFRGKRRVDQLSSTEYIGGLYRKSTVNKLPLMRGGERDHNNKEGESGSFFSQLNQNLQTPPPEINSDWSRINQNCTLPPWLVTLLIAKKQGIQCVVLGPTPTSIE